MVRPSNDLGYYDTLMERDDIPMTASPSVEIQWVAFKVPKPNFVKDPARKAEMCRKIWEDAPSKVAATWLRQLRLKKNLQTKFWTDTWPYYMENRLALELRAAAPPPVKRGKGGVLPASTSRMKNDGTISVLLKDGEKAGGGNGAS